ncbi:hypothetical protein [Amycolatopsis sp. NPDC051903]|uniref:hypothetical protein n=1 Tax=Amycolatopsis sp. NPDC051903 TaxID=3363936 RepID=UPI0037A32E85
MADLTVLVVLVRVMMLPQYRKLRFSVGFWSFIFPPAAIASLAERWLGLLEPAGWRTATGILAGAFTVFLAAVAAFSLRPQIRRLGG